MPKESTLFLSDLPLTESAAFNFDSINRTLHEFIRSAPVQAPLNVCVTGDWGTGKTTLLRGLEAAFAREEAQGSTNGGGEEESPKPAYTTIWFDPWKLSSEEEVRNALARAVLEKIESDASFSQRARIEIDRKNVIRMLSERLLQVNPDDVSAIYKADSTSNDTFAEVEAIFRRVATVYLQDPDHPRRLVIFVDDLDRCRPPRTTKVLESVKLFFDLPGLIFVFALDRGQLEKSVAADYEFTSSEARTYLEKVFQLTVPLPRKSTENLRTFLQTNLDDIGVKLDNSRLAEAIVESHGHNLRRLKLFINSFSFQRKLIRETADLADDVLVRWEYLQEKLDRSLAAGFSGGSANLILALEFLAHGGFLHNAELRSRYMAQLSTSSLNYVVLIAASLVSEQIDTEISSRLSIEQEGIVKAMQADGGVATALQVVREGQLLIDSDLPAMVYLTRSEDVEDLVVTGSSSVKSDEKGPSALAWGSPLTDRDWNTAGDDLLAKGNLINAYLCYLVAMLMSPDTSAYVCDVGRTFRRIGRYEAAKTLLFQAYALDPTSVYVMSEVAHLFDVDLKEEDIGSLLYQKALLLGSSTPSVPYNLSWNLHQTGKYEDAYLACLDACTKDPDNEGRLDRLAQYARDAGHPDRARHRSAEDLELELGEATAQGRYPLRLNQEEERVVEDLLRSKPDPDQAAEELSRPPL
jgi:tetratricopeptide (TPR) repeat protein